MNPSFTVGAVAPVWHTKSEAEKKLDAEQAQADYAQNREAYDAAALQLGNAYQCPGCGTRSRHVHASICGGCLTGH